MCNLSNSTTFNDLEWPLTRISRSWHFFDIEYQKSLKVKVTIAQEESIPNIWNDTMFGDLDWPLNASRGFVSISWASYVSSSHYNRTLPSFSLYSYSNLWLPSLISIVQSSHAHFPRSLPSRSSHLRNAVAIISITVTDSKGLDTNPRYSPTFISNVFLSPSVVLTTVCAPSCIALTAFTNHSSTSAFLRAHLLTSLGTLLNAFPYLQKQNRASFLYTHISPASVVRWRLHQ